MSQSLSLTPVSGVINTGSSLQGFGLANGTLFTSTVGGGDYAVGWSEPDANSNNAPTFHTQLFDGSGSSVSGPVTVTSPSEYAEYPSMVGSSQGYFVSWQSQNYNLKLSYPDPSLKSSLAGILQGATNSTLTVFDGSEYDSLGNANAIMPYAGALSILSDGGVGIAYTESGSIVYRAFHNPIQPDEFATTGDPNANLPLTDSTHTQLVGGSGSYPIYLGTNLYANGSNSNIASATLKNGRVAVEWRSLSSTNNLQMNVAVINPAALPTGPDNSSAAIINLSLNDDENPLGTIGVLGNGNFLTFYTGNYHGNIDSTLYAQEYDANGKQVGAPITVDSNADEETSASATLSDGSVALGYSNGNKFLIQIFDQNGNKVGDPLLVTNDDEYRNVSLSALPGNKIAVSWVGEEASNGTFGPKVKTQVFALTSNVAKGPETYSLNFVFSQQADTSNHIQEGMLTAVITGSYGDTKTLSTTATTDDALPLSSGDTAIKAKISKNFAGGGLVFDLKGLASNPNQTAVELHGGHVPDYGQVSGDSQSCVVADSGFMPSLLKVLTQDYQNSTGNSSSSPTDVASWVNSSCNPTMTSADALSQALLNVQNAPKQGGLLFSISRVIEKKVKVLFDVTDQRTGDTTTREAFIQPGQGSTLISYGSLFQDGPHAGLGDKFLTNPQGNENYQSSFNQALSSSDRGDPLQVSIDAYQILYHGGSTSGHTASGYNPWYFDTKPGNSGTDVSGENLMFGNKTSTSFHI